MGRDWAHQKSVNYLSLLFINSDPHQHIIIQLPGPSIHPLRPQASRLTSFSQEQAHFRKVSGVPFSTEPVAPRQDIGCPAVIHDPTSPDQQAALSSLNVCNQPKKLTNRNHGEKTTGDNYIIRMVMRLCPLLNFVTLAV